MVPAAPPGMGVPLRDDLHAGSQDGQGAQIGEFGDTGNLTDLSVGVVDEGLHVFREQSDRFDHNRSQPEAWRVRHPACG